MGCSSKTLRLIFITLNWLIIFISLLLVIFNLLVSFASFASTYVNELATVIGVSSTVVSSFLVLSTLLVSFFSGIASLGMESAAYRDEWDNPIFHVCCCNLLKTKMVAYIVVTMVFGIGLLVATALFHTGLVKLDYDTILESYTLGSCNDVISSLVKPLQTPNHCCGITMTSGTNSTCGNWLNEQPDQCGCNVAADDTGFCISTADATANYGCVINAATSLTDDTGSVGNNDGIFSQGCKAVVIDAYFTGFGVLYGFGYGIGVFLCIAFILACSVWKWK